MVSRALAFRVTIPEGMLAWVEGRLVRTHSRNVRPMVMGLLLNLLVALIAIWRHLPLALLLSICGGMIAGLAHRLWLAGDLTQSPPVRDPIRLKRRYELSSIWLGALGGLLVALALPVVPPTAQIILILSFGTQLGALAFNIRTLPRAAICHIALLGLGIVLGLAQLGTLLAWAGIVLVAAANVLQAHMIRVTHKTNVERILRDREMRDASNTVRMLLNDYEMHGSDWIIELDSNGCVLHASDRFAASTATAPEALNGRSFVQLFAESSARKDLERALSDALPRRSLSLKLAKRIENETRWWLVNIRPVHQSPGQIVRFRGVASDISTQRQAEARVNRMAYYDSLTELPNRLMFHTSLQRMFGGEIAFTRLAVMLIDCDHFKAVNDMYGHPLGDRFLSRVADRLRQTIADSGLGGEGHLIARLGGDEFGVILSGDDVGDQSIRLADVLIAAFDEPFQVEDHEIDCSISIGMAIAPEQAHTADALISYADIALYAAKDDGRGRWEMFQAGMDEELLRRHALARDLRNAVTRGELRLFLQPLVNVETRKHIGFEALLRWEHPERGIVMPDEFIPIAEETGLIVPMGEWVIRTALKEAATWPEPLAIAINLSPVQIRNPMLISTVVSALAESGIDPARVELEITESVLMSDSEANIALLNQLHALGVKVALDDFGTGYASLNYLLTFPFDKIKIDRSFISELESREESRAIVAAVISLANKLGMCTLAEGVEHESQLVKLRDQGCEMVQGWLFGKALPAEHYSRTMDAEYNSTGEARRAA